MTWRSFRGQQAHWDELTPSCLSPASHRSPVSSSVTVSTALTALFEFAFVFSERPSKSCAQLFLLANDNSD